MTSADASWAVDAALSADITECMEAQGFTYGVANVPRPKPTEISDFLARRYGAPTRRPDGAAGYAFDDDDTQDDSEVTLAPAPTKEQQTVAYQRALYGSSGSTIPLQDPQSNQVGEANIAPDGCMGISIIALFGSVQDFGVYSETQFSVESIASQSFSRLYSDPAAIEASVQWADCMQGKGFSAGSNGPYRTPLDPGNQDWPSPRPSALERATADADIACRSQTGVDSRLAAVEGTWQTQLLESQPDLVQQMPELYDHVRAFKG